MDVFWQDRGEAPPSFVKWNSEGRTPCSIWWLCQCMPVYASVCSMHVVLSFCRVRHFFKEQDLRNVSNRVSLHCPSLALMWGQFVQFHFVDLRGLQLQSHAVPSHSYLIWRSPKIIMHFMFLTLLYFPQKNYKTKLKDLSLDVWICPDPQAKLLMLISGNVYEIVTCTGEVRVLRFGGSTPAGWSKMKCLETSKYSLDYVYMLYNLYL